MRLNSLLRQRFSLLQRQTLLQGSHRRREGPWQRAILFGYTPAASQDKWTTSNNSVVLLTWLDVSNEASSQAERRNKVCSQHVRLTLDAWKNPTGGSHGEPAVLFRWLAHMAQCCYRYHRVHLAYSCVWNRLAQMSAGHAAATRVLPSKVCWITWRKPEVWAQSARYPSQRHSSEHPVIPEHHAPHSCLSDSVYRI